jgi:2-keto-4-pentenoate hydratase/2-oxohepta-3-ene-1,7-dioic acid hydratase in catechol pathway
MINFTIGAKSFQPQRIFCIGQNYRDHIEEMNSEVPDKLVVFMKPPTSLVLPERAVNYPQHGNLLHYEGEVVVLIGKDGYPNDEDDAVNFVAGLSLGLDLTMRDVQSEMRKKGGPWETSKAFDQSAPVGIFVPYDDTIDLANIPFTLKVNGDVRQDSNTNNMIFSITRTILDISKIWRLMKGDLIYTGTPAGVGELTVGDTVEIESDWIGTFGWKIG